MNRRDFMGATTGALVQMSANAQTPSPTTGNGDLKAAARSAWIWGFR